jgi:hypothetical protein
MERYKNKRMMFRSGNGEFRAPKAADMGIGGVCKVCGHLLLEVYEGDKTERFIDPMKFRYRCFTCEPEAAQQGHAPDAAIASLKSA